MSKNGCGSGFWAGDDLQLSFLSRLPLSCALMESAATTPAVRKVEGGAVFHVTTEKKRDRFILKGEEVWI